MSRFGPTASRQNLELRANLLRQIRSFFDERNFIEVDTPLLSADTVVDRHLEPIIVPRPNDHSNSAATGEMFLQTSPEFAMKRLVASGMERIYQVAHAFRASESGDRHNPEFTMVEWYRVGDDQTQGIELLGELASALFESNGFETISYRKVFADRLGVDPLVATSDELARCLQQERVEFENSEDEPEIDTLLELLMAECIQPHLGKHLPIIVYDYPSSQSALARTRRDGESEVAERFELFFQGMELANGYHELLDADELLRRNLLVNDQRERDGKTRLPEQSRMLEAMRSGLPACSGVALGFDRVVMLKSGAKSISEVIAFPIDIA